MTEFVPTALGEVVEITPPRFGDDRGWFSEVWNEATFRAGGVNVSWVQDNESLSGPVGTLRGIHYQARPQAQDKLVRVIHGRVLDIAVDLRQSSSTYLRWVACELSAEKGNQLFVPQGFGHGFVTLVPDCVVAYKVSSPYNPELDRAIAWDDPAIGIDWGIQAADAVLSPKDASAPRLADATDLFT